MQSIQYTHNKELTTANSWNKTLYMYFYAFFIQQQNLIHPDIWRFYINKTFKKAIPCSILFHFSICMYTIITYDRMVSSPYTYFSVSCFSTHTISHQVTYCKGIAQAGFVILTRYLQSIEYSHCLLSISQMRLLFCHVPERVLTRKHHYQWLLVFVKVKLPLDSVSSHYLIWIVQTAQCVYLCINFKEVCTCSIDTAVNERRWPIGKYILVQHFPKHVECGSVEMAPHAVQI